MSRKRVPITDDERRKPFIKYYYQDMAKPAPERLKLADNALTEDRILKLAEVARLVEHPERYDGSGFCVAKDGATYVQNTLHMPMVTAEMIDWWFAWYGLEPIRYKIWDPYDHFDVSISDDDRRRLLDSSIPVRQRIWGVTHNVREDIGLPRLVLALARIRGQDLFKITVNFVAPSAIGLSDAYFLSHPECTAVIAKIEGSVMLHFVSEKTDGATLHSRFWFDKEMRMPSPALKCVLKHNIIEYTNLAAILPHLYEEEGRRWI